MQGAHAAASAGRRGPRRARWQRAGACGGHSDGEEDAKDDGGLGLWRLRSSRTRPARATSCGGTRRWALQGGLRVGRTSSWAATASRRSATRAGGAVAAAESRRNEGGEGGGPGASDGALDALEAGIEPPELLVLQQQGVGFNVKTCVKTI